MFKKYFNLLSNIITIVAPIILLFLDKEYFDKGESICLSVVLSGYKCYACGMTKAVMHFIHFDFVKAWEYNKLSFIVVPMLFGMWVKAIYDIQGKRVPGKIGKLMYPKEA